MPLSFSYSHLAFYSPSPKLWWGSSPCLRVLAPHVLAPPCLCLDLNLNTIGSSSRTLLIDQLGRPHSSDNIIIVITLVLRIRQCGFNDYNNKKIALYCNFTMWVPTRLSNLTCFLLFNPLNNTKGGHYYYPNIIIPRCSFPFELQLCPFCFLAISGDTFYAAWKF